MSEQPPRRAVEITTILERTIRDGRLSLQIAGLFQQATSTGPLPSNRWLYAGIRVACWRDALMSLARLTDRDTRSISLTHLLDYSRDHPDEYPLTTP
jgi:hypothetical protein